MKANTVRNYNFTGDFYEGTILQTGTGTPVVKYAFSFSPKMTVSTNLFGELVIYTNTVLQLGGIISKVKDRNGDEIYPGSRWTITNGQPVLDGLGVISGYKYRASDKTLTDWAPPSNSTQDTTQIDPTTF